MQERNRVLQLELQRNKVANQNAKVEKTHKELEIQNEAARIAKECDINAKLNKVRNNFQCCIDSISYVCT